MSKNANWRLWMGFLLILLAPFFFFLLFNTLRGAFWISIVLIVLGVVLFADGWRRASAQPELYRGKVAKIVLSVLSLLMIGVFAFGSYMMRQAYSEAKNAPHVGDKAPEFALIDGSGRKVTIAQLLATPVSASAGRVPRGVLLVFYRGYW